MRTRTIISLIVLVFAFAAASAQKKQQVISSGGNTDVNGDLIVEWTLGEPVTGVGTFPSGAQMNMGFHQHYLPPPIPTVSEWGLIAFCLLLANIGLVVIRVRSKKQAFQPQSLE